MVKYDGFHSTTRCLSRLPRIMNGQGPMLCRTTTGSDILIGYHIAGSLIKDACQLSTLVRRTCSDVGSITRQYDKVSSLCIDTSYGNGL